METANIMLALGGDAGNTVPKYGVTVAEIAVLRLIHGESSVTDVEPVGEIERTNRQELERLNLLFRRPEGAEQRSPVATLFPGAGARVFTSLDELDIPEDFYKAETRVVAKKPAKKPAKATPKRQANKATEAEVEPDDGIGDINDGVLS